MKNENRDFFYFDPEFSGEIADFTNDGIFTADERKEFLAHYSEFLKS